MREKQLCETRRCGGALVPTGVDQRSAMNPIKTVTRRSQLTVLLSLLCLTFLFAQHREVRVRPDIFRFADGVLHTYSAPARWDGKDVLVLTGVFAGTMALTFLDEPVRDFWRDKHGRVLDGLERVGYHYGKPYAAFGLTGGLYLTGVIFKNEWAKETGLILGTSLLTSATMMGLLKNAAGRGRPELGMDHLQFRHFDDSPAWHSFPSGHSSVGFGISLVLARRVESVPLKITFYSLAGITAMSRMYTDAHWMSDVGFGGMIAWFCADTAIRRMQVNRFRAVSRANGLVWNVYPYPGGITLRASM